MAGLLDGWNNSIRHFRRAASLAWSLFFFFFADTLIGNRKSTRHHPATPSIDRAIDVGDLGNWRLIDGLMAVVSVACGQT